MDEAEGRSEAFHRTAWTGLVVGIGLVLGVIFVLLPRPTARFELFRTLTNIDIVVSWVSMSLIVALLLIESQTYSETKSPLALGLFFVLGAFLFQAVLTSPTFYSAFGMVYFGGRPSMVLAADFFEALAFSVFLYLNL